MVLKKSEKIYLPTMVDGTIQMCEYRVINHMKGNQYLLKAASYCVHPQYRTLKKSRATKSTLRQCA